MAKNKGRAILLQISDGASGFDNIAGITGKSLSINNERIDVTTPDPTTPDGEMWKESLDGVKSVALSGDGKVIGGNPATERLVALSMGALSVDQFRLVHPSMGTFQGQFSINSLEFGDDGSATFSVSLESDGVVAYTAPA